MVDDLLIFDWQEIHGKTLTIFVGEAEEDGVKVTCVMGRDVATGEYFVIAEEKEYTE